MVKVTVQSIKLLVICGNALSFISNILGAVRWFLTHSASVVANALVGCRLDNCNIRIRCFSKPGLQKLQYFQIPVDAIKVE